MTFLLNRGPRWPNQQFIPGFNVVGIQQRTVQRPRRPVVTVESNESFYSSDKRRRN
jgi:hypothetical protein